MLSKYSYKAEGSVSVFKNGSKSMLKKELYSNTLK